MGPEHLRWHQLGGPIVKNKTFFFAGFQGNNIDEGLTTLLTVPTALMHQGIFTGSRSRCAPRATSSTRRPPAPTRRPASSSAIRFRTTPSRQTASTRSASRCWICCRIRPSPTARRQLPRESRQDAGRLPGGHPHRSQHQQQRSALRTLQLWKTRSSTCRPGCRTSARTGSVRQQPDVQDPRAQHRAVADASFSGTTSSTSSPPATTASSTTSPRSATCSNKSQELGIPGANLGTDETSSLTRMTDPELRGHRRSRASRRSRAAPTSSTTPTP